MNIQEFIWYIKYEMDYAREHGYRTINAIGAAIDAGTTDCISLGCLPIRVDQELKFDDALLKDKDEKERQIVREWIRSTCVAQKTANERHTSYGLKHFLEADTGIYLTNNQFKNAMLIEGHNPVDETELNWEFCISERKLIEGRKEYLEKHNEDKYSEWIPVSPNVDTYTCKVCDYNIQSSELVTPHCPWCGRQMLNWSDFT